MLEKRERDVGRCERRRMGKEREGGKRENGSDW